MHRLQQIIRLSCLVWLCFFSNAAPAHFLFKNNVDFLDRATCAFGSTGTYTTKSLLRLLLKELVLHASRVENTDPRPAPKGQGYFILHRLQQFTGLLCLLWVCFTILLHQHTHKIQFIFWIKSSCSFSKHRHIQNNDTHPEQSDALFMLYAQAAANKFYDALKLFFQKSSTGAL